MSDTGSDNDYNDVSELVGKYNDLTRRHKAILDTNKTLAKRCEGLQADLDKFKLQKINLDIITPFIAAIDLLKPLIGSLPMCSYEFIKATGWKMFCEKTRREPLANFEVPSTDLEMQEELQRLFKLGAEQKEIDAFIASLEQRKLVAENAVNLTNQELFRKSREIIMKLKVSGDFKQHPFAKTIQIYKKLMKNIHFDDTIRFQKMKFIIGQVGKTFSVNFKSGGTTFDEMTTQIRAKYTGLSEQNITYLTQMLCSLQNFDNLISISFWQDVALMREALQKKPEPLQEEISNSFSFADISFDSLFDNPIKSSSSQQAEKLEAENFRLQGDLENLKKVLEQAKLEIQELRQTHLNATSLFAKQGEDLQRKIVEQQKINTILKDKYDEDKQNWQNEKESLRVKFEAVKSDFKARLDSSVKKLNEQHNKQLEESQLEVKHLYHETATLKNDLNFFTETQKSILRAFPFHGINKHIPDDKFTKDTLDEILKQRADWLAQDYYKAQRIELDSAKHYWAQWKERAEKAEEEVKSLKASAHSDAFSDLRAEIHSLITQAVRQDFAQTKQDLQDFSNMLTQLKLNWQQIKQNARNPNIENTHLQEAMKDKGEGEIREQEWLLRVQLKPYLSETEFRPYNPLMCSGEWYIQTSRNRSAISKRSSTL